MILFDFILLLILDKSNADIPPEQHPQFEGYSARESQEHPRKCLCIEKVQHRPTETLTNKNRGEACWLCFNVYQDNFLDEERNREEEVQIEGQFFPVFQ